MIDAESLQKVAEIGTVAEHLGLEVIKKGSKKCIRCPDHPRTIGKVDNNIGNCVLSHNKYRCYSCGSFGGVFDLVMSVTSCSFTDALQFVASIYGGEKAFESERPQREILSSAELALIGLSGSYDSNTSDEGRLLFNCSLVKYPDTDKVGCVHKHKEFVLYAKRPRKTLLSLYEEDPLAYYSLIADKAKEAVEKYSSALTDYSYPDGNRVKEIEALFRSSPKETQEHLSNIRKIIREKQKRAEEIARKYSSLKKSSYTH